MSESFFNMFGSVKIVQEISTSSPSDNGSSHLYTHLPIEITSPTTLQFSLHKPKRKYQQHTRKNSYLKQLRKINRLKQQHQQQQQQYGFIKIYSKSKSQKLLCLWPLPTITRYTIFLSLILSTFHFLGVFQLTCSSPTYVIHRFDVVNLFLSPFFCLPTLKQVVVFAWNLLILGLFEESLTHMLGGSDRFIQVFFSIVLSVCTLRQGIGYLFSKSTGWAVPSLFFSESLHECSQGLAPFLFALLVVQSINMDDKYILMYNQHQLTMRKVTLQFLMCLVNYTIKNILWWSLTGLLTGFIATIIIQIWLAHDKHWDTMEQPLDEAVLDMTQGRYRSLPLWHTLQTTLKKMSIVLLTVLPFLFLFNGYYTRERFVAPQLLNQLSYDRYLFTFVIMTAPRRGDPPFLTRTIGSYLQNWPEHAEAGSLYDRIQMLVYTHFTVHDEYDRAKQYFYGQQKYLKWVREDGDTLDQRGHVSKALSYAADHFQSTYIALVEDDFPVCGTREWRQIENVVYRANIESPNHCGIFVGTGGKRYSGLFLKPKIAKLASGLLLKYPNLPPDIIIQQCLLGNLRECQECSQTLVTSKTLLMYHIGYNTSTSLNRSYKKDEFQCGWRHPFNGDPSVMTL